MTIEQEEIPKDLELTYYLEGPCQTIENSDVSEINFNDFASIIFCIDTSGSMSCTKPVLGVFKFMNKNPKKPNNENLTFVSRLEFIQAAVELQISNILNNTPNKKVGLVCFGNKVTVLGDGSCREVIPNEAIFEFDGIMNFANSNRGLFMNNNISQSHERLTFELMKLKACGGTALGPALLASILISSEGGKGSSVVICTDGLANEGIGSFENNADQDGFYKEIANIAQDLGVSVSVISIEGQECRLESLEVVTEQTGGSISKVASETITTELENILANNVIATQVVVSGFLHRAVKFNMEPENLLAFNGSKIVKTVGNATFNSSFSLSYSLKSNEELNQLEINKAKIQNIPFQALVKYTTLDGRKCLRAITKIMPVTFDRNDVDEADIEILARCGRRKAVKLAKEGKLKEAKENADM